VTALEEGRSALGQGEWEAARAAFERAGHQAGRVSRRQGRAGEAARLFAPYRRDGGGYYLENSFRLVRV